MIKFDVNNANKEVSPLETHASNTNLEVDSLKDYIDSLFQKNDVEYQEELMEEIFDYDKNDCVIDFDFNDPDLLNMLDKIKGQWDGMDDDERKIAVNEFAKLLCFKLDLESIPEISYYCNKDANDCGFFTNRYNAVYINEINLDNYNEIMNTLAHELRHAYQYQRAEKGETHIDDMYKCNFDNYISTYAENGHYIKFMDYYNQFIEVEARTFAENLIR